MADERRNILLYFSDQHTPMVSECYGGIARTPVLNDMARKGTIFDAAYTSCPLCVPARMALMSGRLPTKTGILNNYAVLPDTIPTIAHAFAAAGYETTLIGRMHFVGENQNHGFEHRLVGDCTPPQWKPERKLQERFRGPFMTCFDERGCTDVMGGGNSPILEYDALVTQTAVDWLSQPHDRPQFIIVGTYAPHFPYVAPIEKYRYYLDKVTVPESFDNPPEFLDPAYRVRLDRFKHTREQVIQAQAAYCGMVEQLDENIGKVRDAFWAYQERNGQKGAFMYSSDHGDMCGDMGLFAKMSLFETSARIPLVMEGDGIEVGVRRKDPVSIIDYVPTLCGYAGIENPPCIDGVNVLDKDVDMNRAIVSEVFGIFGAPGKFPEVDHMNSISRMVRKGQYKFITRADYEDWDILFDLDKDPKETVNIIKEHPEIAAELRKELEGLPSNEEVKARMRENWKIYDFMQLAQKPSRHLNDSYWTDSSEDSRKLPSSI